MGNANRQDYTLQNQMQFSPLAAREQQILVIDCRKAGRGQCALQPRNGHFCHSSWRERTHCLALASELIDLGLSFKELHFVKGTSVSRTERFKPFTRCSKLYKHWAVFTLALVTLSTRSRIRCFFYQLANATYLRFYAGRYSFCTSHILR